MGALSFNLTREFAESGGFSAPNFVFFEENLQTGEKFGGKGILAPSPTTTHWLSAK